MELRALRAAQRTAQWRAALACLAELRRRQAGSILSFNFALGALKSAGRWRQSLQLLAEVFWANLQATAVTLSSALCVLPWRRAASLLADGGSVAKDLAGDGFVRVAAMGGPWVQGVQSLERGGTGDPDAVINALLGSLTKAARWREGVTLAPKEVVGRNSLARAVAWPRSLGIVRTLEATCLQATTVSYNSALVNLRWTQGLMLLSKVEKNRGLRPSCVTYNTLVASATWRVALALASLARLRRASDAVTYNTAISGSEWRWALVVLDTLGSEVVALNAAASACEKASQWQQALALALGSADVVTWSAAVAACEKAKEWQRALEILASLRSKLQADVIIYNSAISACEGLGKWQHALLLLQEVHSLRLASSVSYNACISACEKCAKWQQALGLLSALYQHKVEATVITYNSAISACQKASRWKHALLLLAAVQPDVVTFNACILASPWQQALGLLARAGARFGELPEASFLAALGNFKAPRWRQALALVAALELHWPPDTAYQQTVDACAGALGSGQVVSMLSEVQGSACQRLQRLQN
ncbi:unnamed protein product [Effrenium voratum]|nr:unnamed protein product [Effrenium voratum]